MKFPLTNSGVNTERTGVFSRNNKSRNDHRALRWLKDRRTLKRLSYRVEDAISRCGRGRGAIKRKMSLPDTVALFSRTLSLILHKRAFKWSAVRFARFPLSSTGPYLVASLLSLWQKFLQNRRISSFCNYNKKPCISVSSLLLSWLLYPTS